MSLFSNSSDPNSIDFDQLDLSENSSYFRNSSAEYLSSTTQRSHFSARFGTTCDNRIMREGAISVEKPGAWFFEETEHLSGSPFSDSDDAAILMHLNETLGVANVTHSVDVPTSEHVAEIVGRQGCKIKALRAKTNTYIKTPIRGEDPVFVVTGRINDVLEAKREIECAAEHFTQIRASRRHSQGGTPAPGHVTAYVRVPLRVVGLVVGPKGATIKRIQQDTHTYIITPSREREPVFEVTGLPLNVEAARKEIEQHIYQRTGNMPLTEPFSGFPASNTNSFSFHNSHQQQQQHHNASTLFGLSSSSSMSPHHQHHELSSGENLLRSMAESNLGLNALLRSFPSMRNTLTPENLQYFDNYPGTIGGGKRMTSPLNQSSMMNRNRSPFLNQTMSNSNFEPWSNHSLSDLVDNDVLSRNFDTFSSSLWNTTLGLDSKMRNEKRNESPTNGIISLNGGSAGFGLLQSIWSDMSVPLSTGSVTSPSASPSASPSSSPTSCDQEKTIVGNEAGEDDIDFTRTIVA